ncbi:UPF0729 protein AAEL015238 [Bombyx mandarina]|uniref:Uncharacterized protein n=2 Tax=Bombyx TaxID=7090 RepID=A0A8R1WIY9_BOMMO|nr:UPF0729 protein AAEL015238 [Bombyx mori]XP_028028448.1 UPF0729 protein AAEL015238 [Bombyx mandarina]
MVCVPCFIIPLLLFLWHRFVQPYILRFWNPWAVKDKDGNVMKTEFPFQCKEGVCVFARNKNTENSTSNEADQSEDQKTK